MYFLACLLCILCILLESAWKTGGQDIILPQMLFKYVKPGTNPNTIQPQFTEFSPATKLWNTGSQFVTAASVCSQGMWALYNVSYWGQGVDDPNQISVTTIRGFSISECTPTNQMPGLQSTKSLAPLGVIGQEDGLKIFTEASFLGGIWEVSGPASLPEGISGIGLGSLAITGQKAWLICGDDDCLPSKSTCVDMRFQQGGMFYAENTRMDYYNSWPKVVRSIQIAGSEDCMAYSNPIFPEVTTEEPYYRLMPSV